MTKLTPIPELARARLARLVRLRQIGAPRLIVKNEQLHLWANRMGYRKPYSVPGGRGAVLYETCVRELC